MKIDFIMTPVVLYHKLKFVLRGYTFHISRTCYPDEFENSCSLQFNINAVEKCV